jgi:hypothetical protein
MMRTRFINWIDRVWSAMREEHVCTCDCDPDGAYDDGYYNGATPKRPKRLKHTAPTISHGMRRWLSAD